MAVITERAFKDLLSKFKESANFYYNEPVNKLLGESWTKSDLQNTMLKFTTSSENLSAESYYKDKKYWLKIYRGEDSTLEKSIQGNSDKLVPMRYFRKQVFYIFEYAGNIESLPDWITQGHGIVATNKPGGEFKLMLEEDDWLLIQENDIIVYDVDKNRFTIYDSVREIKKLYISEQEIVETRKN